jgi:hypothetical protein
MAMRKLMGRQFNARARAGRRFGCPHRGAREKRSKTGDQSGELLIHFDSLDALSGIFDKLRAR